MAETTIRALWIPLEGPTEDDILSSLQAWLLIVASVRV